MKYSNILFALLFCLCSINSVSVSAVGLYWESEIVGLPGSSPNAPVIAKSYQTPDGLRIEKTDEITIINFKSGTMYSINPTKKTYSGQKIDQMMNMGDKDPEANDQMQKMMSSMMSSMEVKKTEETKKISGYNCTKYIVTMMGFPSEYWVTTEVKGYKELQEATKKYAESLKSNPMISNIMNANIFEKIDGFPIQVSTDIMGTKSSTRVIKVEQKNIDSKMMEPPADYARVERN